MNTLYVAPDAVQQARIIVLTTALQQAAAFAGKVADRRVTPADIQDHLDALNHALQRVSEPNAGILLDLYMGERAL